MKVICGGDKMSAVMKQQMNLWSNNQEELWQAVVSKDARFDGQFVFAVSSTGIYCRPSCPSRRPHRQRVAFFESAVAARDAGFRACKRCNPDEAAAAPDP